MTTQTAQIQRENVGAPLGEETAARVRKPLVLRKAAVLMQHALPRKSAIVLSFVAIWQAYIALGDPDDLLFPGPRQVAEALLTGTVNGDLLQAVGGTLKYLSIGFGLGLLVGTALAVLASLNRACDEVVSAIAATLTPLPSIALIPLALVWFGVGPTSLVVVVVNAVAWPVAVNLISGFRSVSPVLIMVGQTLGLNRRKLTGEILIPAAAVHLVGGVRVGWIFAWRTAIGAELVFGSNGANGGLGIYINNASMFLRVADLFAGLVSIAIIGLVVESIFQLIERHTVVRWGMTAQPVEKQKAQV